MPLSKEEEAELATLEKKRSGSSEQQKEGKTFLGEVGKGFQRESSKGGLIGGAVGALASAASYGVGKAGEVTGKSTESALGSLGASPRVASIGGNIASMAPDLIIGGGVGKRAGEALAGPIAEHMMAKAISPTGNLSVREADKLTQAALEHGINVSRGGVQKLRGMLRDLGGKAEDLISNSKAVIHTKDVLRDLTSPEAKGAFRAMRMRFKGGDIPIKEAQRAKQEISRRLSDYSYRDLNMSGQSAKLEGMKQLQSVLRNKIEQLEPGIKDLNSKMHDLFSLRPHLEKRVVQNMQKTVGTGPLSVGARAVQQGGSAAGATAGGLGGIGLDEAVNR